MMEGWSLRGNDTDGIIITRGEFEVKLDIRINTSEGCVWAGYFRRTKAKESELAAATLFNKVSIQKANDLLGHLNEEATRATTKFLDWNLTRGALKNCEFCAKGKGKEKNAAKKSKHVKTDVPGK